MAVINAYVGELSAALRGPRRAKADLLTEARDSLADAAEAYQRRGLCRESAERRAVAEFGAVAEIAPGYQAELGLAQGRRTALLMFLLLTPQHMLSEWVWRSTVDVRWHPDPAYDLLSELVDWVGLATVSGSLLAVAAFTVGVRYLGVRRGLVRATGIATLVMVAFFTVAGAVLTFAGPLAGTMLTATGLAAYVAGMAFQAVVVVRSGRRCVVAA